MLWRKRGKYKNIDITDPKAKRNLLLSQLVKCLILNTI